MNQIAIYEGKAGGQIVTPLFDNKKLDLLKNTICKGSNDEEFELFLHACQRTGLDPFMRQIYAVKRWDSQLKRESMTIQTGIDGYRLIAERTGRYSPGKEPTYQYDGNGNIVSATAYVKKQTSDGTWHEIASTAFFNEYCQKTKEGKPTRFWMQMAHTMLAKCAEALALRKAFPGDLSGLYTKEEMLQADLETPESSVDHMPDARKMIDSTSKAVVDHIVEFNDMIQNTPKTINKSQWTELNQLIDQCSPPFQQKIWDRLAALGIQSMADLDEETFKKMKDACLGNIAKHNKSKQETECATC